MKIFVFWLQILLITPLLSQQGQFNPDEIIKKCNTNYALIQDYTAVFDKKELIDGKILEDKKILIKYMKPDHYYLKWLDGKKKGIESLYVTGKYKNKEIVHLNSFFGLLTVHIDPQGSSAMKNNRHPITDAGLGSIINLIVKNYTLAQANQDLKIICHRDTLLANQPVIYFKISFSGSTAYYGHCIEIYFEHKYYLPVKITVYGQENELLEDYHFYDLAVNVGLSEYDFDIDNPQYGF